ncbi:homocysteine S-methyltransferase family protein [Microvirga lenta]|uniref:homocysteine S-methyltransferase family protein n=1 Tax=Microvirga lenta TaxID=2881337 RepID=UPI001CFFB36A|nr:homocysteine S-methyltransferase family protein [Microvirga lenta]MCB5175859.1 homocysteine S-methyltransferase family protein [Microvirga lenta]
MAFHRPKLPQLSRGDFLTDGGLETTLVFHQGLDLPCFAAFPLIMSERGKEILHDYFRPYLAIARRQGIGFILDTVTWRANADWGAEIGYSADDLADIQRRSVAFACHVRDRYTTPSTPIVINGILGPRGDGYRVGARMRPEEAQRYHSAQIDVFRDTEADMVTAMTLTYPEEAIGIVRSAQANGLPVAISFTVETDGRLPSGDTLESAIEQVDAATGSGPAYYMINCAHPSHFESVIDASGAWIERIRGLRANASELSHAELDVATELDPGDPAALGGHYRALRQRMKHLCVIGGCCGTDHTHIQAICEACAPLDAAPSAELV